MRKFCYHCWKEINNDSKIYFFLRNNIKYFVQFHENCFFDGKENLQEIINRDVNKILMLTSSDDIDNSLIIKEAIRIWNHKSQRHKSFKYKID